MKIKLGILSFFAIMLSLSAQERNKYWIHFADKNEQVALLERPNSFLSDKAIERRKLQGIEINETDLPVSRIYLNQLVEAGIEPLYSSRWFNMTSAKLSKEELRNLNQLPFIEKISLHKGLLKDGQSLDVETSYEMVIDSTEEDYYGLASRQINMLNGVGLHDLDYKGQGMTIAVLDAGFLNANILPVFDNAWAANRIIVGPDFVRGNDTLVDFSHSTHGTNVLGFMASELPDVYVGTAPLANYILIRTENGPSEAVVEEYYWLQGAEYADSMGADLINSSLGYTTFDDSTESHSYDDLDGNTTLITKAADMAAAKGILVVNSAGNSGANSWYYISAPADADSVMTVGSVNGFEESSLFSSHGPTADDRIKPNVVAHGELVYTVWVDSAFYPSNGTSFSAPVLTGMTACLWQYKRALEDSTISNMEIIELVESSSSQYPFSDPNLGYGIPNFGLATAPLSTVEIEQMDVSIYPNPFNTEIHISSNHEKLFGYSLVDVYGRVLIQEISEIGVQEYSIQIPLNVSMGNYFIIVESTEGRIVNKLVK